MTMLMLTGIFFINGFAQNAPKIQRAYAFYSITIPGMAMQDDKGNTIDPIATIDRSIFVESPGTKMPDIRSVSYNKILYKAVIKKLDENAVQVGTNAETEKEIVLSAKKGNSLWKLELQLMKDTDKAPKDVKHIIIQGRYNKRPYSFNLYNETKLASLPRY